MKLLRVPALLSELSRAGLWHSSWRREGRAQLAPELARVTRLFTRLLELLGGAEKGRSQSPLRQAAQT